MLFRSDIPSSWLSPSCFPGTRNVEQLSEFAINSYGYIPIFLSACCSDLSFCSRKLLLLAINQTLSLLWGAPTAQAGITIGWTVYPSASRSLQIVSTTYSCPCSLSFPEEDLLSKSTSLPGCTIERIPATFSPIIQGGLISRMARLNSGQR